MAAVFELTLSSLGKDWGGTVEPCSDGSSDGSLRRLCSGPGFRHRVALTQKIRAMRLLRMALVESFALQAYRKPRNERITPTTTTSPTR
jgi:hypothetical protein